MFEWFLGPLLIMKEQIKRLNLEENEETCLRILIMRCRNEKPEDWDEFAYPSSDTVRRAQLQAIFRRFLLTADVVEYHFLGRLNHHSLNRLQGIVSFMSRIPSFRRRFMNLIKVLYVEGIQMGSSATAARVGNGSKRLGRSRDGRNREEETINTAQKALNVLDV